MSKQIVHFSMKRHGYFIDLEGAECAVSVTPNEGDVLLHEGPGEGRLNGVCIPGSEVVGFEADRVEGAFGVRVWYNSGDNKRFHDIGITETPSQAEAWVVAVNQIYSSGADKLEKAADGFRLGPLRSKPVIHDIIDTQQNIILPGTYLYSRRLHPPPFPEQWKEFDEQFPFYAAYAKQSILRLQDFAHTNIPIECELQAPPPHDYTWLSQRVRYKKENFKNRVTQPLEIIFEHEERKDKIAVIPDGAVSYFAVLYWKGQGPAERLSLKPHEPAASSFEQWISQIAATASDPRRIIVLTPSYQMVDYALQDAIAQRKLSEWQRTSAPAHLLAEYLWVSPSNSIIACDVGVAYQLIHRLQTERQLDSQHLAFSLVPYPRPITVGFCYRVDDPDWGVICNAALRDVLQSKDSRVQEHLARIRDEAKGIYIDRAFAA